MALQAAWSCLQAANITSGARNQISSSASCQSSMFVNAFAGWKSGKRFPVCTVAAPQIFGASSVADAKGESTTSLVRSLQLLDAGVLSKGAGKVDAGNKFLLGQSEEQLIQLAVDLGEGDRRPWTSRPLVGFTGPGIVVPGVGIHTHLIARRTLGPVDILKSGDLHAVIPGEVIKMIDNVVDVDMSLPKAFKEALANEGWQVGRSPVHHVATSTDGTIKVLLKLADNLLVETVGIPALDKAGVITRLTACISSQVGCALRCSFCATGKGGFSRNLKPHEIVQQVLVIEDIFKHRVSNVVFMGMGEPMMNLSNVLAAYRSLNKDIMIGQRMMTISTVGVPNTIAKLATHKLQCTLAISLHAPNQELRSQIVPSARAYPLEALLLDCRNYFFETGRRVTFEYTLLDGVNDRPEHAEQLANLLYHWKLSRHVNVIPYNPISDSEFRRPRKAAVMAFIEALKIRKVTASIRQTRGLDANAACGQLRNDFQKVPMPTA